MFGFVLQFVLALTLGLATADPAPDVRDIGPGLTQFYLELYQQCSVYQPGNVIISPYSLASSLVLLSGGAEGTTFEQMKNVMHISADKENNADYFELAFESFGSSAGQATLDVVNKIYVSQSYTVKQSFKDLATQRFYSGVETIDFDRPVRATKIMNDYVKVRTNGNIKDLFRPGAIRPLTRMALVNTVNFKGDWETKFDEKKTKQAPFFIAENKTIDVPMMYNKGEYGYAELPDLDAKALQINFAESKINFLIILPNQIAGLPALNDKLKTYNIHDIPLTMETVDFYVPKFKFDYTIELTDVLQQLKMTEIFTDQANFSGLLDQTEPLSVTEIFHKTVIDFNESGCSISSGSGILVVGRSISISTKSFKADHPFFFAVISEDTDATTIISNGQYMGA